MVVSVGIQVKNRPYFNAEILGKNSFSVIKSSGSFIFPGDISHIEQQCLKSKDYDL